MSPENTINPRGNHVEEPKPADKVQEEKSGFFRGVTISPFLKNLLELIFKIAITLILFLIVVFVSSLILLLPAWLGMHVSRMNEVAASIFILLGFTGMGFGIYLLFVVEDFGKQIASGLLLIMSSAYTAVAIITTVQTSPFFSRMFLNLFMKT